MIKIDPNKCPGNHRCPIITVCPVNAIIQTKYEVPRIDENKCIKCGKCVRFCAMRAISIN